MNERIRELYKQAGFTVARGWGLKDTVPEDVFIANVCVSNEMKKFAELIVRECAKLLPPEMTHGPDGRPLEQVFKQHFGVEQ